MILLRFSYFLLISRTAEARTPRKTSLESRLRQNRSESSLCTRLRHPTLVQRTAALGFAVFDHFEGPLSENRAALLQLPAGVSGNKVMNFAASGSGGFVPRSDLDNRD